MSLLGHERHFAAVLQRSALHPTTDVTGKIHSAQPAGVAFPRPQPDRRATFCAEGSFAKPQPPDERAARGGDSRRYLADAGPPGSTVDRELSAYSSSTAC